MVLLMMKGVSTVYGANSLFQLRDLSNYAPFSVLCDSDVEATAGIQTPHIYLCDCHAFWSYRREDMNFYGVNHLLWGCHRL